MGSTTAGSRVIALEERRQRHASLTTRLAFLNDAELRKLIRPVPRPQGGWGSSGLVTLGSSAAFVKRIPITSIELENQYCTKNHYRLPTYYSYGIGSAGLGVWREILAVVKSTGWVLEGACTQFPITYHHRILKLGGRRKTRDPALFDAYFRYWNDSAGIRRFINDRECATHEVVLFLERFPYTLRRWLPGNLDRSRQIFQQLDDVITFLRSRGMVHFDCHHWNIVTDGQTCYLTDFGLVMDADFELSDTERRFLAGNTFYDRGTFAHRGVEYLVDDYRRRTDNARARILKRLGAAEEPPQLELEELLLNNIELLTDRGLLKLDPVYVEQTVNLRDVSLEMSSFFRSLITDARKRARLDNEKLEKLFERADSRHW